MLAKKGQSTLEYVIVLTAIIAVVIVVAAGLLKTKTTESLEHVATQMKNQVENIHYAPPTSTTTTTTKTPGKG